MSKKSNVTSTIDADTARCSFFTRANKSLNQVWTCGPSLIWILQRQLSVSQISLIKTTFWELRLWLLCRYAQWLTDPIWMGLKQQRCLSTDYFTHSLPVNLIPPYYSYKHTCFLSHSLCLSEILQQVYIWLMFLFSWLCRTFNPFKVQQMEPAVGRNSSLK